MCITVMWRILKICIEEVNMPGFYRIDLRENSLKEILGETVL